MCLLVNKIQVNTLHRTWTSQNYGSASLYRYKYYTFQHFYLIILHKGKYTVRRSPDIKILQTELSGFKYTNLPRFRRGTPSFTHLRNTAKISNHMIQQRFFNHTLQRERAITIYSMGKGRKRSV